MFLHLFTVIVLIGSLTGKPIIARNISDCTIADDGILHYHGKHSFTKFDHECLLWSESQTTYSNIITEPNFFNDLSIKAAENYCRNPDMDINGPWCLTQDEDEVFKEYCDVCQSLTPKPTLPTTSTVWPDDDSDENINNDFFHNLRNEFKRFGAYIRDKFGKIFEHIRRKVKQIGSSISTYFN